MSLGADVGDVDFDCGATWERSKMRAAKRALDASGIAYERRGRGWLLVRLGEHAELYFAPVTGSLRFGRGRIFSSKGLPLALEIVKAYL